MCVFAPVESLALGAFRDIAAQPWENGPYQLHSWWAMEKFSAANFYNIVEQLGILSSNARLDAEEGKKNLIAEWHQKLFETVLRRIRKSCEELALKVSIRAADSALSLLKMPGTAFSEFGESISQLSNTIHWEMDSCLFFHVPLGQAEYYEQSELFGPEVNAKFPSIQFDMVEAGNCCATGRGTACVFHLMRIMETGVQSLGSKLGIAFVDQKNWQNILDEVNKAIKTLPPKDPATVEMSQASANLYAVKLAWRNEVMHPKDTYTLEEARRLLGLVKSFMQQLAEII